MAAPHVLARLSDPPPASSAPPVPCHLPSVADVSVTPPVIDLVAKVLYSQLLKCCRSLHCSLRPQHLPHNARHLRGSGVGAVAAARVSVPGGTGAHKPSLRPKELVGSPPRPPPPRRHYAHTPARPPHLPVLGGAAVDAAVLAHAQLAVLVPAVVGGGGGGGRGGSGRGQLWSDCDGRETSGEHLPLVDAFLVAGGHHAAARRSRVTGAGGHPFFRGRG